MTAREMWIMIGFFEWALAQKSPYGSNTWLGGDVSMLFDVERRTRVARA